MYFPIIRSFYVHRAEDALKLVAKQSKYWKPSLYLSLHGKCSCNIEVYDLRV